MMLASYNNPCAYDYALLFTLILCSLSITNGFSSVKFITLNPLLTKSPDNGLRAIEVMKKVKDSHSLSELDPPPGCARNIFFNFWESLAYVSGPDEFIKRRYERYGPIFFTYLFFRPTVIVGGQDTIREFITKEHKHGILQPSLPAPFAELHTEFGTTNLDSNSFDHKQMRVLYKEILGPEAIEICLPIIRNEIKSFLCDLKERTSVHPKKTIFLAKELKKFCLILFSKVFTGSGLSQKEIDEFEDYNRGILALSKSSSRWKKAKIALGSLQLEFMDRFIADGSKNSGEMNDISKRTFDAYIESEAFPYADRNMFVGTSKVILVWGAYIESAALILKSIITLTNFEISYRDQLISDIIEEAKHADIVKAIDFPLARGVSRESLRLNPPGGGAFRMSDVDIKMGKYRIPAGTVISADPRISNFDDKLFPNPDTAIPERWWPEGVIRRSGCPLQATALNNGPGSWFPGGIGAHQCPGIHLAETVCSIFLGEFVRTFENWEIVSGTNKKGDINYILLPIKIPVNEFGVILQIRDECVSS